jgi:hypothetical protein
MANTNFSQWYDDVLPYVPGCPQAMALNAIRKAAIEFCEKSWAWIYNPAAQDVVASQIEYPFSTPSNAVVNKVLRAWYDNKPIHPLSPDQLDEMFANWRTTSGTPEYHTQEDERNLLLVQVPAASLTGGLKMRLSLKPKFDAADIESRMYEEYREAIASGALYRLMSSPKKPYSDPNTAIFHKSAFDDKAADVRHKVQKGYARAPLRNTPHFF